MHRINDMLSRAGSVRGRLCAWGRRRRGKSEAFTLLEILIAIAALGLIAVGVASIFDATGKTLATGKRISVFNAYANLIEQQMRADIAAIADDSFIVIRNEYADGDGNGVTVPPGQGDDVYLYDGEENGRLRRIDELVIFAKGEFVSARSALDPAYIAKSDAARIYYGHGQRARQSAFNPPPGQYYIPELDGVLQESPQSSTYDADARLGYTNPSNPNIDPPNPNRFASEWILLRQVTLLAPPRTAQPQPQNAVLGFQTNDARLKDSMIQVSLQPAASDIFRALAAHFPVAGSPVNAIRMGQRAFCSGLLDIAATDLARIRTVVTTTTRVPDNNIPDNFYDPASNTQTQEENNPGADGQYRLWPLGPDQVNQIRIMHQWMEDAFPANSMSTVQNGEQKERIRCELSPRNYIGSLDRTQWATQAEAAYRPADQVMLSASNFLPRCTEFIVEWSFGKVRPSDSSVVGYQPGEEGQFIWHGMERRIGGKIVTNWYNSGNPQVRHFVPWVKNNGSVGQQLVTTLLIHGPMNGTPPPGAPLTSYFGYFDPTFNPDQDPPPNGDGKLDLDGDSRTPTIPWARPKLIRVTLSLADPADPSIERTFQFVFEVPDGR